MASISIEEEPGNLAGQNIFVKYLQLLMLFRHLQDKTFILLTFELALARKQTSNS